MPQVINTNVLSLNAQRNLDKSQGQLGVSLQRLSSGLRVNNASDDAAGLAISNRMTAQIRGVNQAARNAADGISLAQTGEGGLQEITNNLQRMRELAVQARNATNTASDRASIDAEFQQLLSEIDRVAQTTSFNGRNVLDGSLGTAVFQVGANVGETVSINVSSSARTGSIGQVASVTYQLTNELNETDGDGEDIQLDAAGELVINGTNIAASTAGSNGLTQGSAEQIANAVNASKDVTGVTASAGSVSATVTAAEIAARAFTDVGTGDVLSYTLSINGTQIFTELETDSAKTASDLAGLINNESNTTGVTAVVDSSTGDLLLTTTDGRNIEIQEELGDSTNADADLLTTYFGNSLNANAATSDDVFDVYKGGITFTSGSQFNIDAVGVAGGELFSSAGAPTNAGAAVSVNASGLSASNVLNETQADLAIQRIDQALTDVDTLRGVFGAIQSRFESTVANLQTTAENVSAARSRIRDADFAAETAALTRAQVLQQAGVSVLSQANAQPQLVLALLQ